MEPTDTFKCAHFHGCEMQVQRCVQRQEFRKRVVFQLPSGDRKSRESIPLELQYCASGTCSQGNEIRTALEGKVLTHLNRPNISWSTINKAQHRIRKGEIRRRCSVDGCELTFSYRNTSGKCTKHRHTDYQRRCRRMARIRMAA